MMEFICPDSLNGVCTETRCGRCLVNPREDGVDDNLQPTYTAACTFDGTLQYFHGLKPTRDDKQKAAEAEAAKREGEGETKSTKRRAGVSVVMGREAHPAINVESGKWITVFDKARHEKRYFIRGEKNWILMNKFLSSLKRHDDHSANHWPVDFNSNEYSATRDYFRAFVDTYVERQPAAAKRAHHLYESRARIRIELLGNPDKDARIGDITDAILTPKKKNPHR